MDIGTAPMAATLLHPASLQVILALASSAGLSKQPFRQSLFNMAELRARRALHPRCIRSHRLHWQDTWDPTIIRITMNHGAKPTSTGRLTTPQLTH